MAPSLAAAGAGLGSVRSATSGSGRRPARLRLGHRRSCRRDPPRRAGSRVEQCGVRRGDGPRARAAVAVGLFPPLRRDGRRPARSPAPSGHAVRSVAVVVPDLYVLGHPSWARRAPAPGHGDASPSRPETPTRIGRVAAHRGLRARRGRAVDARSATRSRSRGVGTADHVSAVGDAPACRLERRARGPRSRTRRRTVVREYVAWRALRLGEAFGVRRRVRRSPVLGLPRRRATVGDAAGRDPGRSPVTRRRCATSCSAWLEVRQEHAADAVAAGRPRARCPSAASWCDTRPRLRLRPARARCDDRLRQRPPDHSRAELAGPPARGCRAIAGDRGATAPLARSRERSLRDRPRVDDWVAAHVTRADGRLRRPRSTDDSASAVADGHLGARRRRPSTSYDVARVSAAISSLVGAGGGLHGVRAADGQRDPVGDVEAGVAAGLLDRADQVAGQALGGELRA